jgi:hypothetical protein
MSLGAARKNDWGVGRLLTGDAPEVTVLLSLISVDHSYVLYPYPFVSKKNPQLLCGAHRTPGPIEARFPAGAHARRFNYGFSDIQATIYLSYYMKAATSKAN